ncbi:hypothetical protein D3C71_1822330 [compost metagenome]
MESPAAGQILTFPQLQRIVRPRGPTPTASTVIRWATKNHVRLLEDGSGGVMTTIAAVNAALGLHAAAAAADYGGLKEQI